MNFNVTQSSEKEKVWQEFRPYKKAVFVLIKVYAFVCICMHLYVFVWICIDLYVYVCICMYVYEYNLAKNMYKSLKTKLFLSMGEVQKLRGY